MLERAGRARPLAFVGALFLAWASSAAAKVDVTLDAGSLNQLLTVMAPSEVKVSLTEGRSVTLHVEDLKVTGFDPTEGEKQEGFVLTSCRIKVPELSVDMPLTPRLSLQVADKNGKRVAFLRFEKVLLPLPFTGSVDVAPLLPVLPMPTDTTWTVPAESGNVRVRTILNEARMGAKNLRLTFDLEAAKAP